MSTIAMPEIPLVTVPLEARELLGDVPADLAKDPDRFSFGRDDPSAVTPATPDLDDEIKASLDADHEHRFVALRFTCSFRPDDDPLVESRLVIRLSSQQAGDGGDPPVARSLQPDRLVQPIARQTGFTLTPSVTVGTIGVGGIGGSRQDTVNVQDCYLVANGKRQSTADWFFRATKAVALEGMYDLRLIAQVRQGVPALAEVMMTAKIQRRAVGVITYRAALPEQLRTIPLPA
jgi:hypothetical protein